MFQSLYYPTNAHSICLHSAQHTHHTGHTMAP